VRNFAPRRLSAPRQRRSVTLHRRRTKRREDRPLRILLVSDLHYALKQFDWTASVAERFDLVVLAGDHLDIAGQLDGNVQIVVVLKYLKRLALRTKLIVSSGNHDLDVRNGDGEKIASWMNRVRQGGVATDGDTLMLGDTLITICPWWDGPAGREAVGAQLARDAAKPKKAWFWVYHAPPAGSPTAWNGRKEYGDEALTEWIQVYQPDIIFAGHIHEAPFKSGGSWADRIGKSWVFNSGRQMGPIPTHIALDTEAREAVWFSMAGDELVRLDAPLQRLEIESAPAWLSIPARDQSLA
jgi:Icc-related predicted phosphoesterase